jgi:hypothetical protein
MGFGIALGSGEGEYSGYSGGLNSLYFRRELWKNRHQDGKEGEHKGGIGDLKKFH